MNITDLMIGDWVFCYHPLSSVKARHQVTPEILDLMYRMSVGRLAEDNPTYRIIEPIPLTPEILMQNNFEPRGDNCFTYTYSYGWFIQTIRCYVKVKNCLLYIDYGDIRDFRQGVKLEIKHVHELQHALKLCGIDKEIVL